MRLCFCITIKNRSNVLVDYEDSTPFLKHVEGQIIPSPYPKLGVLTQEYKIVLPLLPRLLRSLVALKQPTDDWCVVVTDFQSTDANVRSVLETELGSRLPWILHTVTEWPYFDRGGGLKKAAEIAETQLQADAVFFCDADLVFFDRAFIDECYATVSAHKFYYPIFFAFADPLHEQGFWRETSFGNFGALVADYKTTAGWMHNISWGWEDRALADSIPDERKVRTKPNGFCHQWHPMKWDFRVSEYPVKEYLFKNAAVTELPSLSK
jgi:hypothetical protein